MFVYRTDGEDDDKPLAKNTLKVFFFTEEKFEILRNRGSVIQNFFYVMFVTNR